MLGDLTKVDSLRIESTEHRSIRARPAQLIKRRDGPQRLLARGWCRAGSGVGRQRLPTTTLRLDTPS